MRRIFTYSLLSLVCTLFCSSNLFAAKNSVDDIVGLYAGKLTVDLSQTGILKGGVVSPDQILLKKETSTTIGLSLTNFSFGELPIGDINLTNIPIVQLNDTAKFSSSTIRLEFLGGSIVADVKANGVIVDRKASINIEVGWVTEPTDPSQNLPIPVYFEGNIVHDGLRLNDIKLSGVSIPGFNSDKFGYGTLAIKGTETLTSVRSDANTKVNIELDGNWIYLHVTDGVNVNTYTLANMASTDSIKKINLSGLVYGDLKIWDGVEISGDAVVDGNIIYVKPINGQGWNVVGLPYTPLVMNAILPDNSKINITDNIDSYYYGNSSQTSNSEEFDIRPIKDYLGGAMVFKLKSNTDAQFIEFILPKNSDISLRRSNENENKNYTYPNNSFVSASISDFAPSLEMGTLGNTVFYIFDGSKFVRCEPSTVIAPSTPYIMAIGSTTETLAMPDDPSWTVGVEKESVDNISIYSIDNILHIKGYYGKVEIYSISGLKIAEELIEEQINIELQNGTYIVRTATKATVIIIK